MSALQCMTSSIRWKTMKRSGSVFSYEDNALDAVAIITMKDETLAIDIEGKHVPFSRRWHVKRFEPSIVWSELKAGCQRSNCESEIHGSSVTVLKIASD